MNDGKKRKRRDDTANAGRRGIVIKVGRLAERRRQREVVIRREMERDEDGIGLLPTPSLLLPPHGPHTPPEANTEKEEMNSQLGEQDGGGGGGV